MSLTEGIAMDIAERAMALDISGVFRTAKRNESILEEHQTIDVHNETPGMSWVELYQWLGY